MSSTDELCENSALGAEYAVARCVESTDKKMRAGAIAGGMHVSKQLIVLRIAVTALRRRFCSAAACKRTQKECKQTLPNAYQQPLRGPDTR